MGSADPAVAGSALTSAAIAGACRDPQRGRPSGVVTDQASWLNSVLVSPESRSPLREAGMAIAFGIGERDPG
jgi:hypothetical protein